MVLGLLTSLAWAGDVAYALSTARIRDRPSTAATMVGKLPVGTAVTPLRRLGGWVELERGWVHHSLLGKRWVAPPRADGLHGPRGLIVAWTPTTLFELTTTPLSLCATPLDDRRVPPCMELEVPRAMRDADHTTRVAHVWDRHGRRIQGLLGDASSGLSATKAVVAVEDALDRVWSHVVTPDGGDRILAGLEHDGRRIWTAPDYTRTTVTARRLGHSHLLVELAMTGLDGCCPTQRTLVVQKQAPAR